MKHQILSLSILLVGLFFSVPSHAGWKERCCLPMGKVAHRRSESPARDRGKEHTRAPTLARAPAPDTIRPSDRTTLLADRGRAVPVETFVRRNRLKIASYNMLDFGPRSENLKLEGIASQILNSHPDLLGGIELTSLPFAEWFARTYLNDEYRVLALPGKSDALALAFLVRRDLPVDIAYFSFANTPITAGHNPELLTRDAPLALLRLKGEQEPFLGVMLVHNKSSVRAKQKAALRRKLEGRGEALILESVRKRYPGLPVAMLGDFNAPLDSEDYTELRQRLQFRNAIDSASSPYGENWTNSYGKSHGPGLRRSLVDGILVSPEIRLLSARIQGYVDPKTHQGIAPPDFMSDLERDPDLYPSDHLLVEAEIAMPKRQRRGH